MDTSKLVKSFGLGKSIFATFPPSSSPISVESRRIYETHQSKQHTNLLQRIELPFWIRISPGDFFVPWPSPFLVFFWPPIPKRLTWPPAEGAAAGVSTGDAWFLAASSAAFFSASRFFFNANIVFTCRHLQGANNNEGPLCPWQHLGGGTWKQNFSVMYIRT